MAQTEHKHSAAGEGRILAVAEERSRPAGGNPVVEGKAFLAVKYTVVEGTVRLVVADSRAEKPDSWSRPEVVETVRVY